MATGYLLNQKFHSQRQRAVCLLPPGVNENEKVQIGFVVKVGPGYPIPSVNDNDEPWKNRSDEPKYVPSSAKGG